VRTDDGADIALALEAGGMIDPARRRRFLDMLDGRTLVVGDGLLLRWLRAALPGARLQGLGEALGNIPALRRRIASADFYVIEARAYHADHARLVAHYDVLRKETGCAMNLDLQRIAMPATRASGYPGLRPGFDRRRRAGCCKGRRRRASWSRMRPSAIFCAALPMCRCCTWPNWRRLNEEAAHA
jgi:hypothetical protein